MINSLALIVIVLLNVDRSGNHGLAVVEEEEHGDHGEDQTHPVPGDSQVDVPIALEGDEGMPPAVSRGLSSEGNALLSQALDVLVDVALQNWFDLLTLDHLDNLALLLVEGGVLGADLL